MPWTGQGVYRYSKDTGWETEYDGYYGNIGTRQRWWPGGVDILGKDLREEGE